MAVVDLKRRPGAHDMMYRVLPGGSKEWFALTLPGNQSTNIRAFGRWISGLVDESLMGQKFRLSPGRHAAEGYRRETVDDYLAYRELYRPGTLFLYNVEGRRYYQWDTHDGDSEVILVEGDDVYYRVDQSIYKAHIGEKAIGAPELVVEGKEVTDIHWAFFGPEMPQAK